MDPEGGIQRRDYQRVSSVDVESQVKDLSESLRRRKSQRASNKDLLVGRRANLHPAYRLTKSEVSTEHQLV